jgi:hypothetical protein
LSSSLKTGMTIDSSVPGCETGKRGAGMVTSEVRVGMGADS